MKRKRKMRQNEQFAIGAIVQEQVTFLFKYYFFYQCVLFKCTHHMSREKVFWLLPIVLPNRQLARLQGHTADLHSAACLQGLPGPILQSWHFIMVENYCSLQKNTAKPKLHIFIPIYSTDIYEGWKEPFLAFFWIILSTSYVIIRSNREMLVFLSLTRIFMKLLNYFSTQE